jgi:hypothetical protein
MKKTPTVEQNKNNAEPKNWPQKKKKQVATIPYHPNKHTDSELFWENLTHYSILTLIGVQHELE